MARLAGERAGHPIDYVPISDDEFRDECARQGFPAAAIEGLIGYYAAFRAGWANAPTTDLATILSRAPTPSLEAVARAADSWSWS